MKRLLYFAAICLTIFASCEKKISAPKLPIEIGVNSAFDSMNISKDTIYHLAMKRNDIVDSSICIRFLSAKHFIEYKTSTDTLGLHFIDSLDFSANTTYSEYQDADPANYNNTIGYIFTDYYPIGGGLIKLDTFNFHNYLVADTFRLSIGVNMKGRLPSGKFKPVAADSPKIQVTFFK